MKSYKSLHPASTAPPFDESWDMPVNTNASTIARYEYLAGAKTTSALREATLLLVEPR